VNHREESTQRSKVHFAYRFRGYEVEILTLKSRRMLREGHVARIGERRSVYRVLVGNPEGKKPLERPRRRWQDYIKVNLQEVGCEGMGWIELAQDRDRCRALMSAIIKFWVP
jgi:hypothetical protein